MADYTQVTMTSDSGGVYTAWLPSSMVGLGRRLRIDNVEGIWTVKQVWGSKTERACRDDHLTWRMLDKVLN